MEFKSYADQAIASELTAALKLSGIVLESRFKDQMHKQYGFSDVTIAGSMRRASGQLGIVRRHLTNELKNFYSLDAPGYPVVYLFK